jgi:hypothetical protein
MVPLWNPKVRHVERILAETLCHISQSASALLTPIFRFPSLLFYVKFCTLTPKMC